MNQEAGDKLSLAELTMKPKPFLTDLLSVGLVGEVNREVVRSDVVVVFCSFLQRWERS